MNTKVRLVRCPRCRKVLPELAEVPVYECGGCGAVLQAKKPKNDSVDATSGRLDENFSGERKTEQVSADQESVRSVNSIDEQVRNKDHNEARSSTELSRQEDPESSPETIAHDQTNQEQELDQDQDDEQDEDEDRVVMNRVSEKCKNGGEFEESSGELIGGTENFSSLEIVKDSDGSSKSNFKTLIAEKLLDTRPRKFSIVEDDTLSEDSCADLDHRKRFSRISSIETLENPRFGTPGLYYEGSVSSFDGNHDRSKVRPFYGNARHRSSPIVPENPNAEKLELLKMVRDLQDQLQRTKIPNAYYDLPGRRMAFSGQAAPVGQSPCHHCCPPDHRHFSAQLPLQQQHFCCNGPHYGPAFPVLARPEPRPDNHQRRKLRHLRPISGGAPLIACYRCSELLLLPETFLVFKKRYHSVRCGACSKVLQFTISNGTRVSRYYPEERIAAPPCSEADDYGGSSASRTGPVSWSDLSFQKSYSTETDKRGSLELVEDQKKAIVLKKPTSEIEAAPGGSPLHRLMGYASPSKVIRG